MNLLGHLSAGRITVLREMMMTGLADIWDVYAVFFLRLWHWRLLGYYLGLEMVWAVI